MTTSNRFIVALLCSAPLYVPALLIWIQEPVYDFDLIELYLIFLLLFSSWTFFRKKFVWSFIEKLKRQKKEQSPTTASSIRKILKTLLFIAAVSFILLLIQLFRMRASDALFYFALLTLSLAALSDSMLFKERYRTTLLCILGYYTALCYLGVVIIVGVWFWQPLFLSLAIASNITLYWIVNIIDTWAIGEKSLKREQAKLKLSTLGAPTPFSIRFFKGLYPGLLILSPFTVALLCYLKQLTDYYLLSFVVVLAARDLLTSIRKAEDFDDLPSSLEQQTRILCLLFISLLLLAGVLQG